MQIGPTTLELIQGNITDQVVEALVNAANSGLACGGGVDGAIHRAGGPQIMAECRQIGGCPTGQARITSGGNLEARYVIHAVGPIYNNGISGEPELLASAYRNSLILTAGHGISSIAFPSLSTGAYRYPLRDAAKVALSTVIDFLSKEEHSLAMVRFVLFDAKIFSIYGDVLEKYTQATGQEE
jgi:O-acetyl-ADP-ribose deacetylase (regulator of RNase III)